MGDVGDPILHQSVPNCSQSTLTNRPSKQYICEPRHTVIVHGRTPENGATRQERKQRTRQALLDAALELLEEQSFSSLSLRQVTRGGGHRPDGLLPPLRRHGGARARPDRRVVPDAASDDPRGARGPADLRARDPQLGRDPRRLRARARHSLPLHRARALRRRRRVAARSAARSASFAASSRPTSHASPTSTAGAPRISSCWPG